MGPIFEQLSAFPIPHKSALTEFFAALKKQKGQNWPPADLLVFANVHNRSLVGSICEGYELVHYLADRDIGRYTPIARGLDFEGLKIRLPITEALVNKTGAKAVPAGSVVHGFLLYEIEGIGMNILDSPQSQIQILCSDIHKREISATQSLGFDAGPIPRFPGVVYQRLP